jgi:hypothetical protein
VSHSDSCGRQLPHEHPTSTDGKGIPPRGVLAVAGVRSLHGAGGFRTRRRGGVGCVSLEVELVRSGGADWLVVRCRDRRLRQALADLYFAPRDDGSCAKSFPADSLTDGILRGFRASVIPMLRQTAGLDPVPWREALRGAAERLDGAGVDWWLAGSAALAVRGLELEPRDLDLVVSGSDIRRAAAAFDDALIEPVVETDGWISRWFARAWLGARVEWVAGVSDAVDRPVPSDFGPTAAATLTEVEWEQRVIRLPLLELQRDVCARRGLLDRVALIDALRRDS